MDLEVASHCVAPLTKDYLSKLPHHVLPSMNLRRVFPFEENQDFISDSFAKKLPWVSSVPAPFTSLASTTVEVLNGLDPTTTLIRDKIKWKMKKDKILNAVKKDKKNISEKAMRRAENAEEGTCIDIPRGVALLAKHLDNDPDPQFAGVYNWYYTGGTLATLHSNEEHFLLHANQTKLCCSTYNEDEHKSDLMFTIDLEQNVPVYEIASSAVGAVARQRSCVSLFSIGESDGKLCLNKVHSVSTIKDPFLSVALRDKSIRKYCTLSSKGILKLWDVEYSKGYKMKLRVGPGEGVKVMDSWSSIQFVDNRTLLLADRCCIHLLDARADMSETQLAWCPRKLGELCEQVSHIARSGHMDQAVYTMTTHHILTLDLRIGFGQRWSHMMAAPPYLGFTQFLDEDKECLCLGSQVMPDCVSVVNRWRGDTPQAEYRPMILPSPSKGLMMARLQGLCLEPTLSKRCSQSMIGLTYLPSKSGLHIVRQSATGDVFVQQLISTDNNQVCNVLTDKQLTAYSDWSKPALSLQRESTCVSVSDIKNFVPLLEALTVKYPDEEPAEEVKESGGWRRSKQYLEDCVDMLAPKLLSVWEMDDEEEWHQPEEETLVEQDPAEKVNNWLAGGVTQDYTLADITSLKPKVSSTPYITTGVTRESPQSLEEPSPWMTYPGQTLRTQSTPVAPLTPAPLTPPSLPSSGSDKPARKRRKLLQDTVLTPQNQITTPSKKPSASTAKKKFIPGF